MCVLSVCLCVWAYIHIYVQIYRYAVHTHGRDSTTGAAKANAEGDGGSTKRVWALSPAGAADPGTGVSGRGHVHRLSRIREEVLCSLSMARPPCPSDTLRVPGAAAGGRRGETEDREGNDGAQQLHGRYVWAMPGCAVDDAGGDGVRMLVSSSTAKQTCVPWSEISFAFQGSSLHACGWPACASRVLCTALTSIGTLTRGACAEPWSDTARHLSLEDFLRRYCFEPTWTCPSRACSASLLGPSQK